MAFPLSLRPPARHDDEADSLKYLITRINQERDFKATTEESLREEIENPEPLAVADDVNTEIDDKPQNVEGRRKEVYAARAEMLKLVGQAQNDALTALDFVSLLISKDAPTQADLSMSPFLKQTIPSGTLGYDKSQASRPSKAYEDSSKTVAMGWNLQSLNSAADRLLNSATRLGKEMEREARYWDQILSVTQQGWSVCRMPREAQTIGVRFGFSESPPLFASRGLAAMRPDGEGNIILDQGLANQAKSVRLRILKGDKVIETSSLTSSADAAHAPLETMIHQARDSLFEEELFQEIIKESRGLLSYGVRVVDNVVHIPAISPSATSEDGALDTLHELRIDLIPLTTKSGEQTGPPSRYAETLAVALRLLLTDVYRQKFHLRSQTPKPLSDEKRVPPVHDILRPLLCYLKHDNHIRTLRAFVTDLAKTLENAGFSIAVPAFKSEVPSNLETCSSLTNMESVVAAFTAPLTTTVTLSLPSNSTYVIKSTTSLSSGSFGTSVQFQSSDPPASSGFQLQRSDDFARLQQRTTQTACRAIAKSITEQLPDWTLEHDGCHMRKVFIAEGKTKRLSIVFQGGRLALLRGWVGEQSAVWGVWQGTPDVEARQGIVAVVESGSV